MRQTIENNRREAFIGLVALFLLLFGIGANSALNRSQEALEASERENTEQREVIERLQKSNVDQDKKIQKLREDLQAKKAEEARLAAAFVPAPIQSTPKTNYPVGCEHYRPLVEKYSWDVPSAMRVMGAESGCNPNAANHSDNHGVCMGSFGLFQISCHGGVIYDPAKNVAAAWDKYSASGWQPWTVCTKGIVLCI